MAEHLIEMGRISCQKGKDIRRAYRRKDGTLVKASCVPHKGAKYMPESRKFLKKADLGPSPLGKWHEGMTSKERHSALHKATEQKGCRRVIRNLVAIANVTTDRPTEKKLRTDAKWLHKQGFCHLKTKKD